ncbi:MAG TPA: hypothetical protein V6C78_26135 [Crinalium sp.]
MKRFIVSTLSVLLLSAIAPSAVKAESFQASPFQVVVLANQGYLQDYGIPKYNALTSGYAHGRITARDVVQAAVNGNRVSADKLNDPGYLFAVDTFLQHLTTQGVGH